MKILITGASGFLGYKMYTLYKDKYEVYGTDKVCEVKEFLEMDITDAQNVNDVFEKIKPDVVIHTAALTNVDYCEDHRDESYKINVLGTKNIVDACKKYNAKLVHISTDAVFEGEVDTIYKEGDIRSPINHYAYTKIEAERMVEESGLNYIICRPTILYGYSPYFNKKSFVLWIIESLQNGQKIKIVESQSGQPTLIDDLAQVVEELLKRDANGTFHTAGKDFIDRYHFAIKVAEIFGLKKELIEKIQPEELIQKARRPEGTHLSLEKLNSFGIETVSIEEGLKIMKEQMQSRK